jgi:hypothetical protein
MNILTALHKRHQLINELNQLFSKHGLITTLEYGDLTFTENVVIDSDRAYPKLSGAIIDSIWPSIDKLEVYHFTSFESAESILQSGKFRLTNIEKRYGEHEISSFCEAHGLDGYLEKNTAGDPNYKSLVMPNTYYASFADSKLSSKDQEVLWRRFASCDGVRLTFEITAKNPNFRNVVYRKSGEEILLLTEINEVVSRITGLKFIFVGISRLCAFYLPREYYEQEYEFRILHRLWGEEKPDGTDDDDNAYLEFKLEEMSKYGYKLSIKDVMANTKPKMHDGIQFTPRIP